MTFQSNMSRPTPKTNCNLIVIYFKILLFFKKQLSNVHDLKIVIAAHSAIIVTNNAFWSDKI